ncbi:MAG: SufE family protein [Candidatus Thermoplasmatota archaeon]|nr:SufE family protein [Candidatus Thermoplasmatota archaeon]MEC8954514.1 SufE family protein [Candidatus Thermoplasmatota archaeon]MEC9350872.1 SufE family protein [Candidatus Thermoplasmatota archaeon]MEC9393756.1 SufE family protein [Candidatus Thermoplasmatota archaeon]MEC9478049.1 SufE family protein [Candidatus Thermoplasmatota archaeon]
MAQRRWPEHLGPVVEEFQGCFDSMERYELLFEYAKKHPSPLPPEEWNDANQVHGCQSRAHVECIRDESGKFLMRGGADAQIVQGLMSVTAMAVNGMNPEEVSTMSPDYADAMGIRNSLTPSRANGFLNMFERVRSEAERMV